MIDSTEAENLERASEMLKLAQRRIDRLEVTDGDTVSATPAHPLEIAKGSQGVTEECVNDVSTAVFEAKDALDDLSEQVRDRAETTQ